MIFHGQLRGLRFCGLGGGGVEEGGYKVGLGGWKILGRGEQSGVSGGGNEIKFDSSFSSWLAAGNSSS